MYREKNRTAVIFLTHLIDGQVKDEIKNLESECTDLFDLFILCDDSSDLFKEHKNRENFFLFTREDLYSLDYPGKSASVLRSSASDGDAHHRTFNIQPGDVELPAMHFFQCFPDYDFYWVIEYDVRFSGSWRSFFETQSDNPADLLGTTLTRRKDIAKWYHWSSLDLADFEIDESRHIRGFFPIYRLSRRGVRELDRAYRHGVKGHFEALFPTLLANAGCTIEDIGGDGEFVKPDNRNRFYRNTPSTAWLSPGTFVFRPMAVRAGAEPNMLWHPVKELSHRQRLKQTFDLYARRAASGAMWRTRRALRRVLGTEPSGPAAPDTGANAPRPRTDG